jgi:hypothetical protein
MLTRLWLLGLTAFSLLIFPSNAPWAAPSIYFPEKEWDWGEVYSGDKVVHTFTFENRGDETLKILDIATSCGCTAALITEKEVPPGSKGKIEVTFDTQGYRGRLYKDIFVSTNDPAMRRASLRIYGNIQLDLVIRPNSIYSGFRDKSEILSQEITLTNQGKNPVRLLEVISQHPEVSPEITDSRTIEPGAKLPISIKLKLPETENRFLGQLILRTDHPKHKEIVIPVRLQIMMPIPGKAMEKIPFLEQLRKYQEQKQKEQRQEKTEPSQTPGAAR